jgi:hypothetical protein
MSLSKDDFDDWVENPVTIKVMEKLREHISEAEIRWMQHSWGRGNSDPLILADLRARAVVLTEIINLAYEDI